MKEKYKVTAVTVSLLIFDDMFEWNLEIERYTRCAVRKCSVANTTQKSI